ncbi:hypothetical protein A3844_18360 [Paenibacillus helianthi]|uniref:Oligopeptidase F N-terminal domain-containing protein n=1 Tax=Paenibacillus helianthi TaxID=1349432 RepID=A0ABX3EKG1_9BACL|nr:hypothetical protein [Paenibacillus helianthi]OKP84910.1 hypothetical protein A3844_18360 [Paenibacillus helianthi]
MDLSWELESLYPSFESEKFNQDRELLAESAERLKRWSAEHLHNRTHNDRETAQAIEQFLKEYNAYKSVYLCLFSYAELRFSVDSSNMDAVNRMDELEDTALAAGEVHADFSKWLAKITDLNTILASSAYLAEHEFYLYGLQRQSAHWLGEEAEAVIARMQRTGSKAWERLYMQTLSRLRVDIRTGGEAQNMSLAELRNLVYTGTH